MRGGGGAYDETENSVLIGGGHKFTIRNWGGEMDIGK